MQINHEATYVFEKNGRTITIQATVDPVEQRRYCSQQWNTGVYQPMLGSPLNYTGTGNAHQTFYPEVVFETVPRNLSDREKGYQDIIYYLEDVDAYAVGNYVEYHEYGGIAREFAVNLLDKI